MESNISELFYIVKVSSDLRNFYFKVYIYICVYWECDVNIFFKKKIFKDVV